MKTLSLDAFQLKIIAIIAMLIDHIGAIFFPELRVLRIIGRLTAPIMAFFIAEGYTKTRDVKKYEFRLFIFALISMLPYQWVFGRSPFNILFDLLLGLLVIDLSQSLAKDYQKWGLLLLAALTAIFLETDGRGGISILVYLFYYFRKDQKSTALAMVCLYFGLTMVFAIYAITAGQNSLLGWNDVWLSLFSLISLPFILRYNGERGRNLKYFFYIFYPGHLFVIYLLMHTYG